MAFRAKAELGHFGVAAILIAGALPLLVLAPFAGLLVDRVRTQPAPRRRHAPPGRGLCVAPRRSRRAALLVPLIALLACGTVVAVARVAGARPDARDRAPAARRDGAAAGLPRRARASPARSSAGCSSRAYGFHVPLLVDAASFLVLAAIPRRAAHRPRPDAARRRGRLDVRGVRGRPADPRAHAHVSARSSPSLTCFVLALGVINVVEIYFITTALHAGARGYGLLGALHGVGMLVTARALGRASRAGSRAPSGCSSRAASGCASGSCAFGLTDQLWQAAVLLVGHRRGQRARERERHGAHHAQLDRRRSAGACSPRSRARSSAAQILALALGRPAALRVRAPPDHPRRRGGVGRRAVVTVAPVLRAGAVSPRSEGAATSGAAADAVAGVGSTAPRGAGRRRAHRGARRDRRRRAPCRRGGALARGHDAGRRRRGRRASTSRRARGSTRRSRASTPRRRDERRDDPPGTGAARSSRRPRGTSRQQRRSERAWRTSSCSRSSASTVCARSATTTRSAPRSATTSTAPSTPPSLRATQFHEFPGQVARALDARAPSRSSRDCASRPSRRAPSPSSSSTPRRARRVDGRAPDVAGPGPPASAARARDGHARAHAARARGCSAIPLLGAPRRASSDGCAAARRPTRARRPDVRGVARRARRPRAALGADRRVGAPPRARRARAGRRATGSSLRRRTWRRPGRRRAGPRGSSTAGATRRAGPSR